MGCEAFIKDIHLKHINYKNAGTFLQLKDNCRKLDSDKNGNRMKFTRSFRRAMNVMSKKFSSIVFPTDTL